jgi:Fe2+ or Zn2+ uptake regulation protein
MDGHGAIIQLTVADWHDRVAEAMRASGQRMTIARLAIISWIAAQERPFSAEALTVALAQHPASIGRATAYRTVDWMREWGWLARVQTERGDYTYVRTLPGHHHHAICVRCGVTLLVEGCSALDSLSSLLALQGFQVQGHLLELFGLCASCRHPADDASSIP